MLKPKKKYTQKKADKFLGRRKVVIVLMISAVLLLVLKAAQLHILDTQFLQKKAHSKHASSVKLKAYRGQIKDRNGESLAVSAPVETIASRPQYCLEKEGEDIESACLALSKGKMQQLASLLNISLKTVEKAFDQQSKKKFVYLKKRVDPVLAQQIKALELPGLQFDKGFKRFYPTGEETAHLLGFTDLNDKGQEGLELQYNATLQGVDGRKRVIRDGARRAIEIRDVESIQQPKAGQDLLLSIDERLQYLAYRELKRGLEEHQAKAATLVILEAETGNVLAMVNQPSFNPNAPRKLQAGNRRNRAVTDVFEPGSTVKPLVVAAALEGGFISEDQIFTTEPMRMRGGVVRESHQLGTLSLGDVLKKSSNVAASKIGLAMPAEYFWRFYHSVGFGSIPRLGFPGEAHGTLPEYMSWREFEHATLSFGYRLSMSALQLARAYTILADDGILHSVSLLDREQDEYAERIISADVAIKVRTMIEEVVKKDGTAYKARVSGYRVAGKTGTAKKSGKGGYTKEYLSVFVGMAPASDPKLIIAVMVDAPQAGQYYGGLVAGPIFSKVMGGALRILKIAPDEEQSMSVLLTKE